MEILNVIKEFNKLFYELPFLTWDSTYWLGNKVWKNPMDMWVMQELIFEIGPDFIIETGTFKGGSALFYAHILDSLNLEQSKVITVDIDKQLTPDHKRIIYLTGSSVDKDIYRKISSQIDITKHKILVVLDSDHSKDHVAQELNMYASLVSIGSYCVVEDTNIGYPMEAVKDFISNHRNFIVDRARERFMLTFNPMGYLKRIK